MKSTASHLSKEAKEDIVRISQESAFFPPHKPHRVGYGNFFVSHVKIISHVASLIYKKIHVIDQREDVRC